MSQQYKLKANDALAAHPLDSMTAIYQMSSGITHLVTDPIPAILQVLTDQFADCQQVAALLEKQFELEADGDVEAIVAARLDELWQLGLVERQAVT
ncbi:MAG: HPr-rel-A system PqqD family peptide chaperone [Pseudomonadota bacterium]